MEILDVVNLEETQPLQSSGAGKSGKRCGEHASGNSRGHEPHTAPLSAEHQRQGIPVPCCMICALNFHRDIVKTDCMNTNLLLFERSLGNLRHDAFAGLQTEKLLKSFRSTLRVRFDGGERAIQPGVRSGSSSRTPVRYPSAWADEDERHSIWAHQAGATALAVERFDGRR